MYNINGITCDGYRSSVENKISAIDGVTKVLVELEIETAEIEMKQHISLETFIENRIMIIITVVMLVKMYL